MEELSVSTISPIEYLRILFRRKWFIAVPTFIGLIIGICTGMLLPKKYMSNTVIMVEEGKSDNPFFDKLAISTSVGQRLANIREALLGWNSLVELAKRLHLDKNIKNEYEFEQMILGLRRNAIIRLRSQNILDLAYIGDEPEKTQAIVKNITQILIERNVEIQNKETSDAIKFIEEQLKVYLGKIMSAQIAQLQDQLNSLLADSTEEHPFVKKLREQLEVKKAELKKQNLEYTEDTVIKKEATTPIIDEIKKALDGIRGESTIKTSQADTAYSPDANPNDPSKGLYQALLLDKLDVVMARDIGTNEKIYSDLLQRLETAKITQRLQSSKEGTRYTIIDPPRLPLKPVQPNKPLVAMIGVFLGCVSGVALVFLREFLDKSFIDVQEAKHYLGQPLLGAISRIVTFDTVAQEKERERWIATLLGIGGVIVIIISAFISTFRK